MTTQRVADLNIVGGVVVTPAGKRKLGISIRDGRIAAIAQEDMLPPARKTHDAAGRYVIPGLVDSEAHPGCYVPLKDDLLTESRAVAAAGVTTWGIHAPSTRMGDPVFHEYVQPDNVVSFTEPFDHFIQCVKDCACTDVFLTYMLETDQQAAEIPIYAKEQGVTSFKLYLQAKNPEAEPHWPGRKAGLGHGFDDGVAYVTMEQTAALGDPAVVCMHCENWDVARIFDERLQQEGRTDWAAWCDRSPPFLEAQHVRAYGYFAKVTGCPIYIQHATDPLTYEEILKLRGEGVTCHAQTGPAWLQFSKMDGWRINVPQRDPDKVPLIWQALRDGVINSVGSDHVVAWPPAHRDDLYHESIWELRTGFTSRGEMLLPVLLEGVHRGDITMERLVEVACQNPAQIFGLYPRKGAIEVGADADIVIVDQDRTVKVTSDHALTRSGWTLLEGHTIHGWPVATFLRGRLQARWEDGAPAPEFVGDASGTYLRREVGRPLVPVPAETLEPAAAAAGGK